MERIVDYQIGGRTLKLNCSLQATMDIEKQYVSVDAALGEIDKLSNEGNLSASARAAQIAADMVAVFAAQGYKYMKLIGETCDVPYTSDELMILCGLRRDDLTELFNAVASAIAGGVRRTVEVEPPKNVQATPEAENG